MKNLKMYFYKNSANMSQGTTSFNTHTPDVTCGHIWCSSQDVTVWQVNVAKFLLSKGLTLIDAGIYGSFML